MGKKHASQYANFGWLHIKPRKRLTVILLTSQYHRMEIQFKYNRQEIAEMKQ